MARHRKKEWKNAEKAVVAAFVKGLVTLTGSGPMSIREAARPIGRDVQAVHGDVTALLNAGVLE